MKIIRPLNIFRIIIRDEKKMMSNRNKKTNEKDFVKSFSYHTNLSQDFVMKIIYKTLLRAEQKYGEKSQDNG